MAELHELIGKIENPELRAQIQEAATLALLWQMEQPLMSSRRPFSSGCRTRRS